jgi:hypothetical protein
MMGEKMKPLLLGNKPHGWMLLVLIFVAMYILWPILAGIILTLAYSG